MRRLDLNEPERAVANLSILSPHTYAMQILSTRLANGEITVERYWKMVEELNR